MNSCDDRKKKNPFFIYYFITVDTKLNYRKTLDPKIFIVELNRIFKKKKKNYQYCRINRNKRYAIHCLRKCFLHIQIISIISALEQYDLCLLTRL